MHGLCFVAILTIRFWQAQCVMPLSEHSFLGWYFTPSGKAEGRGRPSTWFHLYCCPDKSSTGVKGQNLLLFWCVWNISCCLSNSLRHPAPVLQCCKHSWSNISCQQQSLFPPEQAFVKVLSWSPPQSLGQPQICWERPTGTKPEARATAQPDSPGWKPEIPGEIQASGCFLLVPLNAHYKPQTTQGQCGCSSAEPPRDILLPGEPALKLLLPYRSAGLAMGVSSWWLGSMGCRSTWFSL